MSAAKPKAFNDEGIQFAFDSTSIKLAEACFRKYNWKLIEGWQPRGKSVHLLFGGWYASGLEAFHKLRADGRDFEDALRDIVQLLLVMSWEYEQDAEGNPIHGTGQPWVSDHNTKTRENLLRSFIWYMDQFQDDPAQTVILSSGKPAVEHSFRLEADDGIILSGHLDRLVDYAGHTYVQDQKTTGSTITARFFEGFKPDSQTAMYTFAGKAIFGVPISGMMIDGAQIAVGFTRFERGFVFYTESELNEWYDETLGLIERVQRAIREREFPANRAACGMYGGCEFRHVCSRAPEVREQFLKGDFERQDRWDPLTPR